MKKPKLRKASDVVKAKEVIAHLRYRAVHCRYCVEGVERSMKGYTKSSPEYYKRWCVAIGLHTAISEYNKRIKDMEERI